MAIPDGYNTNPLFPVLGTDDADNEFASTNVVANADGTILERQEYLQSKVCAPAGASIAADVAAVQSVVGRIARKTVTFANTDADVALFTVTGTVKARVFAVCTTNLASAAGCNLTVNAGTTAIIAQTAATDIDAGEIWHDATPDAGVELGSVAAEYIIAAGADIAIDVENAKQVDSGVLEFYCLYTPLSADGAVVAA